MDELRCRFFGVAVGDAAVDEGIAAVVAGGSFVGNEGFVGGGSTVAGGCFLDGIRIVINGGGIDL